jgi:hypothetical protein
MFDPVRDKPCRSGQERIARMAKLSYRGVASTNQNGLRQGIPEVSLKKIQAALTHSAQEPTEATILIKPAGRRRNFRALARGGRQKATALIQT